MAPRIYSICIPYAAIIVLDNYYRMKVIDLERLMAY